MSSGRRCPRPDGDGAGSSRGAVRQKVGRPRVLSEETRPGDGAEVQSILNGSLRACRTKWAPLVVGGRGRSASRRRCGAAAAVGTALLCLAGCFGLFPDPVGLATLFVGEVQVTGSEGYVLVSVADMPGGGLAAIQFGEVGNEAIALTAIDPASVKIEERNGFTVLAQQFGAAGGTLIAANPAGGVVGGEVLKFTFTVTGPSPLFTVTKAKVTLASDAGVFITTWDLKTTADAVYYTR